MAPGCVELEKVAETKQHARLVLDSFSPHYSGTRGVLFRQAIGFNMPAIAVAGLE